MSALSNLFQDIADAIRSKTGGTDKMNPAAFPAAIAGIQTGGGGGGSFPLGAYWYTPWRMLASEKNRHFTFGGKLYAYVQDSSSTTKGIIRKFEDGVYTEVATFSYNYALSPNYTSFVELNGQLHILGGDREMHYVWDGVSNTCTRLNDLPYSTLQRQSGVVANNTLYLNCNDHYLYRWSESDDTWTQLAKITSSNSSMCVYGTELFVLDQRKNLYKYNFETNTTTLIRTFDTFTGVLSISYHIFIGGFIYFASGDSYNSSGGKLYKYNLETGELIYIGFLPYTTSTYGVFVHNGHYCISDNARNVFELYEVDSVTEG